MAARVWTNITALVTVLLAHGALAQDKHLDLTPAGKAILQNRIAADGHPLYDRPGSTKPLTFPLAMWTGETWIDIGAERISINLDLGLLTFLKNGEWGLVDTAGQVIVEPQFDAPVHFTPGLRGVAWARHNGNWCAVDRHGHPVPGIACADASPMGPSGRFECKVEP